IKSAPALATDWIASSDAAKVGKPAVRYGSSARDLPSARQRAAMGDVFSDKVVANVDPVFDRVGDLDDGARITPVRVLLRQIDDCSGGQQRAVRRGEQAHYRPVDVSNGGVRGATERNMLG